MALVNIINVGVLDNPADFTNPLQFEITFECLQELQDDLEWKVAYVGNAEDSSCDQVLEEVMVGPVPTGINRFVLQAEAPNPALIANQDLIGVTVLLVTCSYLDQAFVQIGYYVNNEYSEEFDPEDPPNPVLIDKLRRCILADEPRVTRFAIDWSGASLANSNSNNNSNELQQQQQFEAAEDDDDVIDMEALDDDDADEEEDDNNNDDGGEVDLADDEAADEEELVAGELGEAEAEEQEEAETDEEEGNIGHVIELRAADADASMEMMNEDSNSMDVTRIVRYQEQQ